MLAVKIILFWMIFISIALMYGIVCKKVLQNAMKSVVHMLVVGSMASWAVFYLISIPLIFMKCTMNMLTGTMCGITFVVLVFGVLSNKKEKIFFKDHRRKWKVNKTECLMLMAFFFLITRQIYGYVVLQHTDADDAEFVVFATSAIQNNELLSVNPYTGDAIWPSLFVKRGMNPFPLLIAFYSQISGIHPAIMSHTVIPVIMLILVYATCWMISERIFKTKAEQILFLIFIALLHTYGYTSVYTNSAFFLLRLWQGKAVLAALITPLILYGCLNYSLDKRRESIFLLIMIGLAGTLTSAISYVVIPIEIMAYFISQSIRCKRFSMVIDGLIACVPSVLFGGVFFVLMYMTGVV